MTIVQAIRPDKPSRGGEPTLSQRAANLQPTGEKNHDHDDDDDDDDDDGDGDGDDQVLGGGHLAHPLEFHPAKLHAEGGHPVDVHLLLVRAAQDVERLVHRLHLLLVVD